MLGEQNSHEFLDVLRGLERVQGELVKVVDSAVGQLAKISEELRKIDDGIRQHLK